MMSAYAKRSHDFSGEHPHYGDPSRNEKRFLRDLRKYERQPANVEEEKSSVPLRLAPAEASSSASSSAAWD